MPSVSYLRNADEIGVMCAIADDCMVCGWQAAVSCSRCSVDASGTWSLAADGSSLSALRAPSRIPVQITGTCMMNGANVARRADVEGIRKISALCER